MMPCNRLSMLRPCFVCGQRRAWTEMRDGEHCVDRTDGVRVLQVRVSVCLNCADMDDVGRRIARHVLTVLRERL